MISPNMTKLGVNIKISSNGKASIKSRFGTRMMVAETEVRLVKQTRKKIFVTQWFISSQ
jgi:hypothetical protein